MGATETEAAYANARGDAYRRTAGYDASVNTFRSEFRDHRRRANRHNKYRVPQYGVAEYVKRGVRDSRGYLDANRFGVISATVSEAVRQ